MSASAVNTLMQAASTAIEALDYATAINKALAAQALLAAMPDRESGGRLGSRLSYRSEDIQNFISSAREAKTALTGIQRTKIQHTRTSAAT